MALYTHTHTHTHRCILTKRKGIIAGILIVILVIASILAIFQKDEKINKKRQSIESPELARAMTYTQVAEGDEATNSQYVNFDAFFLRDLDGDGYAESIRGTCKEIGSQDTVYMELKINGNGTFKNGKITINSDNFYLETAIPMDTQVKSNAIGINTKEIFLNDVGVGTQKMLSGTVKSGDYRYNSTKAQAIGTDISKYSKVNSITLTGTHVADDGTEVEVTKTVDFNIDWYGTVGAELPRRLGYYSYDYKNQSRDIENILDEENNEINLEFEVLTKETKNVLNISRAEIEAEIPQINGYDPIRVEVAGKNITYTYDENTRKLIAQKDAVIDENGKVIENAYTDTYDSEKYNKFNLKITYPIEAYREMGSDTIEIKLPVSGCYYGFNNTNSEFTNPYKSGTARDTIIVSFRRLEGESSRFDTYIGKYVSDPSGRYIVSKNKPLKIYNELSEKETNDTYTVRWYGFTGSSEYSKMIMKETNSDVFIRTDSSEESMENLTKYIGIAFSNPTGMLGDEGEIKVYDDETGDLLATFNKDNWNKYSESNPYRYETSVKRIRVETSKVNSNSGLYVYNVKELDDEYITNNYTREEFDNFSYIKTNLSGYMGETTTPSTDTHRANYEDPISIANVSVEQTAMSTQETEKNYKIIIDTKTNSNYNQEKWSNGSFLLKLPDEIIDIELNEVTVDNNNMTITSYETYEENGSRFIKILTENENPDSYQIVVDANITPDPRISTVTRAIELYATNEKCENYYYNSNDIYDVNNNSNTTEKVNKTSVSINFTSPNSLLTNQIGTNYDEKGSIAVAPQVALVDKDQRKATVEIEVKNNYANTISEIQLLGKVPSEGNTYAISGANLGSTFTSSMTSNGIQVPNEIKEYSTIYYSEKENTTKDINDTNNGWTTTPSNWANVKSYLIVLNNYVMPKDAVHKFTYEIEIPAGLNYNQVSYSHYGVYFSLDTDEGKYRTSVEPNRLGFMIAKEFNIQVTKYQKDSNKLVSGATYSLTEDGTEDGKTRTTNNDGNITIDKVLVEKTYILKEVKSPKQYELNSNEIKFTTKVNDKGELEPELISGTLRNGSNLVVKNIENGYVLEIQVEDEVRPNIKITKTEKESGTKLQGVKFKLTGKGYEQGRILTTNNKGEASLVGLYVNEEYTLEETKAEGHYLASPIKFKIVNTEGNYTVEVVEGEILGNTTEMLDEIPTIGLNIENDKIPTYDLEISKIKKLTKVETSKVEGEEGNNTEEITYLSGAKFKLYKENKEIGEYISDENGKITISNLYQYEEDRNLDQTYVLKEVLAPEGYSKVKDITFKVQEIDGSLQFVEEIQEGQTEKTYTAEGNTVKVTIEDSPSFRLVKKDAETEKVLSGIKFAIYNVDDGEMPAVNSKGETLGTKETINGREYYTLTTDANGVITADLKEGLYKAVEVEAPEKYDISKSIYYFGIGASREGKKVQCAEWGQSIGGSSLDTITSVAETADGGYIAGGYFESSTIDLENGIILNNNGSYDGMIIKYGSNGEIEWGKVIGGDRNDEITSVTKTADGGYAVGGYFLSDSIDLGNGIILNNNGSYDGMLIKYGSTGEVEWAKVIGGNSGDRINTVAETADGGYIVEGHFYSSSIDLGNGVTLNNHSASSSNGMLIKYGSSGEVKWAKVIDGTITSVAKTADGGYVVGGTFSSNSIELGNGVILYNNGYDDGIVIKYGRNGEAEWAKAIGGNYGDQITSVAATADGGYIAGGYFESSTIDLENGVILNNKGYDDGMLIKYNVDGKVEWAKGIGGDRTDYIESVAGTADGGYIAGGYFESSNIDLGNGVMLNNNGYFNGMMIKYRSDSKAECAKEIDGNSNNEIISVAETSDGGYIVGGRFNSSSIDLGDGVILNNNGSGDGMVIKIKEEKITKVVIKQAKGMGENYNDEITSVATTADGGYIVGGYFNSYNIDLENGVILNNNGKEDGMIIKYGSNGEVEWAKAIGGSKEEQITSVAETADGGYIAGGYFYSDTIDLGSGVILTNNYYNYYSDGMIIKYSADGEIEWAKVIGESSNDKITSVASTSDGGYVVGGSFHSRNIDLGNGVILTNNYLDLSNYDGMLIKYGSNGEVEWGQAIGEGGDDEITSVATTADEGYIVGGNFGSSTIDLGDGVILNHNGSTAYTDGMVIKYSADGEVEWGKAIGGSTSDKINTVAGTSDGGYIVGGYFQLGSIDLGNGIILNNSHTNTTKGMIIKYESDGEAKWAKVIGDDSQVNSGSEITSVAETADRGYIVVGELSGIHIDLGNRVILNNNGSAVSDDGMIIKYSIDGKVEWGETIGGSNDDQITSVAETADGGYIVGGYFQSGSIDLGNGIVLNNNSIDQPYSSGQKYPDGIIVKVNPEMGVPDVQEIVALNNRKEFKITTEVKKIDGIAGGIITGGTETVKYGDNSTNEIKMVPDENYEIISITINGKEYPYEKNEDGTYTMPLFENVQEDKHIVVTYALKDNKIIINKVDSKTNEPLSGVKFKLDQIEERNEPDISNIIGDLTDNGQEYTTVSTTNEVTGTLGSIVNGGEYYFVEEDGKYVPTNSKTYQVANGGTAGISSKTANSYIPIDLTNKEGQYAVVVNASTSSENNYDFGYATITESTNIPAYNSATGRFIYTSGTTDTSAKEYTSMALEGGKVYYLHLGYRKDGGGDTGDDRIVFNSIKVYETANTTVTYNFENQEGKYVSRNQGKDDTVANSYIPIDLTSYTGKYNLTVNAEVSSQSSDYGYATVTEGTDRPAYNNSTGRFIYIYGTQSAKDYETVLQGGKMYYLHLGYYKDATKSSGTDTFTVNSINITLNDSELYHTEIETNSAGQAITQIPFGKYKVTELNAPDGYEKLEKPVIIEFRADKKNVLENENTVNITVKDNKEFIFENRRLAKVHVHHYLKDRTGNLTTTKLAEDEVITDKVGEKYTSLPHLDLGKYELEKDENGNAITPENAVGTYTEEEQEVIYYYIERQIPLTVHHYIEGTNVSVPLANGETAKDVIDFGYEGDTYTTNAIPEEQLAEEYELVSIPENACGEYVNGIVEVIYYYDVKSVDFTIIKTNENGEALKNVKFVLESKKTRNKEHLTTNEEGKAVTNRKCGEYILTEIKPAEGYRINPEPIDVVLSLNKENIITVQNEKINYFNLEINKLDSISSEKLSNVEFSLTYNDIIVIDGKISEQTVAEKYITNEEGKINLRNLEDEKIYTLKETKTPKGYVNNTEEKQFIVHYKNNKYEIEILNGNAEGVSTEDNRLLLNIYNEPSLKIVKQNEAGEPVSGAKFTITDSSGNEATKANGELLGEIENIDGIEYRVITSNADGLISANLLPGTYVITEVQAPEGYELPENEDSRRQTVEIGIESDFTHAGKTEISIDSNSMDNSLNDTMNNISGIEEMNSFITSDGKVNIVGGITESTTINGQYTASGDPIEIILTRPEDAANIIINQDGKIEKVIRVTNGEENPMVFVSTSEVKENEYISLGMYMGAVRIPAENTINNEELLIETTKSTGTFLIKYNYEGKVEYLKDIPYIEGIDFDNISKYVIEEINNNFVLNIPTNGGTITIPADKTANGEEIVANCGETNTKIILNDQYEVITVLTTNDFATKPGLEIEAIETTLDGGYVVGTYIDANSLVFSADETTNGEEIVLNGLSIDIGIIIKYDIEHKVEWARTLGKYRDYQGGSGNRLIKEVSGGYISVIYYYGDLLIPAENTEQGEEVYLEGQEDVQRFAILKYNIDGKVESVESLNRFTSINELQIISKNDGYCVQISGEESLEGENKSTILIMNYKNEKDPIITEQKTVVIENKGKPVKIIENTVEKTGTELITKEDDKVTYDISYKSEISEYNGNGTLTIVDQLPFEIDESNSTLNDGTYNEASKTITWTIPLKDINTYKDGNKIIELNKQIAITYKNMDFSKKTFTNKVISKLLLRGKEYSAEDTADTQTNFTKNIEVTKVWNHTNNIYEIPNAVKVQLKRGSTVIAEKDMTSINKVTDIEIPENEDIWKTEFTGLEKYDDKGQEINYTVNEVEVNEDDLKYYQASYDQETKTITNTYVGPVISQTKEAITENGKAYVIEGEKITYKITAKNDGKIAKNVVIKDNIPSGTTYVENSIKIDELVRANTKEELANGITVNIPANGETTISFDVTVNKLDEGTYFKQLKNKAVVDGKDTNETTINVNKSNIVFEKEVTPEGNVQPGQEITYNIKVRNTGSLADKVKIEDNIPVNTTYVKDSIKLGNTEYKDEELNVTTTVEDALNAEELETTVEETTAKNKESQTAVGETTTRDEESQTVVKETTTKDEKSQTAVGETTTRDEKSQTAIEETTTKDREAQTEIEKITLTKDESKITKISVENLQIDSNTEIILSFKVTVNDNISNGAKITNTAVINDKTTNTTENTVIKPVIKVNKTIQQIEHTNKEENRLDYVFKGDKITYNITATNEGDLGGYITIKDIISENTTLETGSIKINAQSSYTDKDGNIVELTGKTADDLATGLEIYVPEKQNGKNGETVISFNVQVKETAERDIENTAIWLEREKTEEHKTETTKVPVVVFEKTATVKRITDTATNLPENTVTANDEIEYTITVKNTGTAETKNFTITDTVPENTTINSSSITNDGILKDNKITWNIAGLQAGETKSVGFTVTVKYNKEKTAKIKNTAYINEVPTNETTTQYNKLDPKLKTNIAKNGDKTAIAGNGINYEISYTGEIKDFVGKANIVIIDQLPYEIDEAKSNLNDGIYNVTTKTITWTIPVENIDTYTSGNLNKEITKNIDLHYKTEAKAQTIENTVTATTQLIELPEEIVKAQEKTASHTVTIQEIQELPATGGKGTVLFVNIGLALIGIGIVILGNRKKFNK